MKEAQKFIEIREQLARILDESLKENAYEYTEVRAIATGGSDDLEAWLDILRKVAEDILVSEITDEFVHTTPPHSPVYRGISPTADLKPTC